MIPLGFPENLEELSIDEATRLMSVTGSCYVIRSINLEFEFSYATLENMNTGQRFWVRNFYFDKDEGPWKELSDILAKWS